METLQTLSVALGLAALAGVNLYLTVFLTGMAVRFQWVALPGHLESLSVLGNPIIIGVAVLLYILEFGADKIPWIDTANDTVHTVIRPVGAALLAVLALGDAHPAAEVVAALLGGGIALTAHTAKAGARLVANASPEPISNIGLSLTEDVMVVGGLGLLAWHPLIAALVCLVVLGTIWFFLPRVLRRIKATLWLAWRKLNGPPADREISPAAFVLPGGCELALRRAHASTEPVDLAVPCLSGGGPRLPAHHFGWIARLGGLQPRLFFVARRWRGPLVVEIPLPGLRPLRESGFLSEKLLLMEPGGSTYVLAFERGHRSLADAAAEAIGLSLEVFRPEPQPDDPVLAE